MAGPFVHRTGEVAVAIGAMRGSRENLGIASGLDEGPVHSPRESRPEEEVVRAVDPERGHARSTSIALGSLHEARFAADIARPARAAASREVHHGDEAR